MKLFESIEPLILETMNKNMNGTNSTVIASSLCSPLLFEMGSLSRDGTSVEYGLCPESWVTLGVSSSLLFIYTIVFFASVVGLVLFWKDGHIRARNPAYMILTLIASTICVTLACGRMIIGRRLFPCAIYMLGSLVIPQLTIMPSCIRCVRVYLMYKLNLKKTKLVELKRIASMNLSCPTDHLGLEPCSPTSPTSPTISEPYSKSPDYSQINSVSMNSGTTSDIFIVTIDNEDCDSKTEMEEEIQSPRSDVQMIPTMDSLRASQIPTTRFDLDFRKVDSPPRRASKKVDFDTIVLEQTLDMKQLEKLEHNLEEQQSDMSVLHVVKYQKLINVISFLVSYKMIIPIYVFFFGIHVAIYFTMAGVEYGYNSNTGADLFLREGGGFFLFSHGCGMTQYFSFVIVSLMGLYIVAEICCLILSFFGDRDTWHIKRETVVLISIHILSTLYFLIGMAVPHILFLVEYFFPSSMIFVVMSICEVVITVLMPIVYSLRQRIENERVDNSSELGYILSRKRSLKIFLDFARRSYCPEAVICYEHIQHYKKCSKRSRSKVAMKIVETYLRLGSPLELNYPNMQKLHDSLSLKISSSEILETDLFDQVSFHCLQDMKELFERFKNQSKEARDMLAQRKKSDR